MTRTLYRMVLWLHPPRFRREFGEEMLWIFDQAVFSRDVLALFRDGLRSLARQWFLRRGSWRFVAATAVALLQMELICRYGPPRIARQATYLAHMPVTMTSVVYLAVWVTGGLIVMVIALAQWTRSISARRREGIRRSRPCSNFVP